MKEEVGGKIMTIFFQLRAKTYGCLKVDHSKDKKVKGTKSVS